VTRPEPTIYGNCESWNFIVGKKPAVQSPKNLSPLSLQACNKYFIHKLFKIYLFQRNANEQLMGQWFITLFLIKKAIEFGYSIAFLHLKSPTISQYSNQVH